MPRTMEEVNNSCLNELHMANVCRNFGMSGQFVEYRPVSDNSYAGLYYVCGNANKVTEIAGNSTYFGDKTHLDPAWVARRELRNPDYFYTDACSVNVSNKPALVALNEIHTYCKNYEAMHTIFKEFGKPIPKKISWEDVKAILELNKGRYNMDYTPELRGIYKERLQKYMDKNFTAKAIDRSNNDADLAGKSNFVDLEYFVDNADDVKFMLLDESDFQFIKKTIEQNPYYADIKIHAGKLKVLDYGIEKNTGSYNPWENFENHIEQRTIGYRNCDEDLVHSIILQRRCAELTNARYDTGRFMYEPCVALSIPFEYLPALDSVARQEGFQYAVDMDYIYGSSNGGAATILYHESDEDKMDAFYNGAMHYTSHQHSEYLGKGQQDRVRADIPKGNLEDLIKQADNKPSKQKHSLFGRNKDAR